MATAQKTKLKGKGKLTAREAIIKVLTDASGKSMKVPAIIAAAVPISKLGGETPGQTIYSTLYAENKKPQGIFKQVGRGEFKLDKRNLEKQVKAAADKAEAKSSKPAAAKPATKTASSRKSRKADEQTLAQAAAADGNGSAPSVQVEDSETAEVA